MKLYQNGKVKSFLWDILVVNMFILNLVISTASNYTKSSLFLKAVSTLLLLSFIIIDAKSNYFQLSLLIKQPAFRKISLILGAITTLGFISLTYSLNPGFGFEKLLHMIFSTIPAVLIFYYLINTLSAERFLAFRISVIFWVFIFSLIIILLNPFDHSTVYSFSFTRASHVISGRFLGLFLIIVIYFLIDEHILPRMIMLGLLVSAGVYSLYLVGMRAALFGFFTITAAIFIYYIFKVRNKYLRLGMLTASLCISFVLMRAAPGNQELTNRYSMFSGGKIDNLSGDSGFSARLTAWKLSLERFQDNPILGIGFGGFRSYYKSNFPLWMKYPHNIILEVSLELGIIGLLFFLYLFYRSIITIIKHSFYLFLCYAYVLFLALLSKDIPSQTILFIFLAFSINTKNVLYTKPLK